MLCIKTKVAPSDIHGLGLFSDQFVAKGKAIWKFTLGFDQRFTREQVAIFPELVQIYLARYSSLSRKSGFYLLCADGGNYFNHFENPNCHSEYRDDEPEMVTSAIRDIKPGEELTDNYANFEDPEGVDNILFEIAKKYGLTDELEWNYKDLV
jgi:uncharacterized protein